MCTENLPLCLALNDHLFLIILAMLKCMNTRIWLQQSAKSSMAHLPIFLNIVAMVLEAERALLMCHTLLGSQYTFLKVFNLACHPEMQHAWQERIINNPSDRKKWHLANYCDIKQCLCVFYCQMFHIYPLGEERHLSDCYKIDSPWGENLEIWREDAGAGCSVDLKRKKKQVTEINTK